MNITLSTIPVLVLSGGKGTRLSTIFPDFPKILAPISGRPFGEILLNNFIRSGFEHFIFATGYKSEQVRNYFSPKTGGSVSIDFSHEKSPLGTGGAIWNARANIGGERFLAVNGDSLCRVNYPMLLRQHQRNKALCTIVVAENNQRYDAGQVLTDQRERVVAFNEKKNISNKPGLINAGIYLFESRIFKYWTGSENFSLEKEFLPVFLNTGMLFAFKSESPVFDIGTPNRYNSSQTINWEVYSNE